MKYILFGAGSYMQKAINEERLEWIDYIVDNSTEKIGTFYCGKEIKNPSVLLKEKKEDIFIIIAAMGQLYTIECELKDMGFEKEKHFEWIGRLHNLYDKHPLWLKEKSKMWEEDEETWRLSYKEGVPHDRAILVSKMIEWDLVKNVLDLGAGSEPMRSLLPENVTYYPVDYKKLTENTIVCDFNKKEFPEMKADVVILVGVHSYVNTQRWLIDKAVEALNENGQLIISFNYSTGNYHAFDFIKKYHEEVKCVDYAFRNERYGIFKFRRL